MKNILLGIALGVCFLVLENVTAHSTYKPEYALAPAGVQLWFKQARTTPAAWQRLGIAMCCEKAERLMTKFIPANKRDGHDFWRYYTDPSCVSEGCKTAPIPDDVIHGDGIKAPEGYDNNAPEYVQMRVEGVLFIYNGAPSCFWPPESGG